MRYNVTTNVEVFNLDDKLIVFKRTESTFDEGRPFCINKKHGQVLLLGNELIEFGSTLHGSKMERTYDLSACNKLLILLDAFLNNQLKRPKSFLIAGLISVTGEVREAGTRNLWLRSGLSELYMTQSDARIAERCIKSILTYLARD